MFAEERLTFGTRRLALGLFGLAVLLFAIAAVNFWRAYPSSYVWSELLISYEGGFVRRGLLGEIAYLLHPYISAQAFLTSFFLLVYVAIAARVIYLACSHLTFGSLLFLVSPVALAFPLNDPEAYARKDALIVATFLLALFLVRRLAQRPIAAFVAVAVCYGGLGFIHEMSWLYFPLAVAFLLNTSGRELPRTTVIRLAVATLGLMLIAVATAAAFKGDAILEAEMVAAWQARVPDAFVPLLAADYLSEGLALNLAVLVSQTLSALVIVGYVTCAFLGGVAVVSYMLERPPALSSDPLRLRLVRYGLYSMLIALAIAADWGRVIHLFWMHAFIFLASIGTVRATPRQPLVGAKVDPRHLLLGLALLILYAATWRMAHAGLRVNPLLPGYIFDLQPLYRGIFGMPPVS